MLEGTALLLPSEATWPVSERPAARQAARAETVRKQLSGEVRALRYQALLMTPSDAGAALTREQAVEQAIAAAGEVGMAAVTRRWRQRVVRPAASPSRQARPPGQHCGQATRRCQFVVGGAATARLGEGRRCG